MANKLNKEQRERRKQAMKLVALGMFLGILIGSLCMAPQVYETNLKYEASTELLMFTINVSNYCAESNNMTYQELLNEFILNYTLEIIQKNNITEDEWVEWYTEDWATYKTPNWKYDALVSGDEHEN